MSDQIEEAWAMLKGACAAKLKLGLATGVYPDIDLDAARLFGGVCAEQMLSAVLTSGEIVVKAYIPGPDDIRAKLKALS